MIFVKYTIIILFLSLSYGCKKEIVRENKPIKKAKVEKSMVEQRKEKE